MENNKKVRNPQIVIEEKNMPRNSLGNPPISLEGADSKYLLIFGNLSHMTYAINMGIRYPKA